MGLGINKKNFLSEPTKSYFGLSISARMEVQATFFGIFSCLTGM